VTVWIFAAACLAGSLGAVSRFVVDGEIRRRRPSSFPWATLVINVTGSLLLGIVTGAVVAHGEPTVWKTVVGTGFCGGYTTFSTAMVETLRLAQGKATIATMTYALGTLVAATAAGGTGLALGWWL